MKKHHFMALLVFIIGLAAGPLNTIAQTTLKQAIVKISGEITTPLSITQADLQGFEQTTLMRKDRDGNNHTYKGVLLSALLEKAGVTMGKDLKGKNLTKYILVGATDGSGSICPCRTR